MSIVLASLRKVEVEGGVVSDRIYCHFYFWLRLGSGLKLSVTSKPHICILVFGIQIFSFCFQRFSRWELHFVYVLHIWQLKWISNYLNLKNPKFQRLFTSLSRSRHEPPMPMFWSQFEMVVCRENTSSLAVCHSFFAFWTGNHSVFEQPLKLWLLFTN